MKKTIVATIGMVLMVCAMTVNAQKLETIPLTPEWVAKIRELAPEKPTVLPGSKRKVLVFSLSTQYQHWITSHALEVIKVLGDKSGAFEVIASNDIEMFAPDKINQFDAVILNNTVSQKKGQNLLMDVLSGNCKKMNLVPPNNYDTLTDKQRREKATMLENSICDFVESGKGLVVVHGGIVFLNQSERFSKVLGGSFNFHPDQQEVTITAVDPAHPLVQAFGGQPFVHVDEPYLFTGEYDKKDFRPLLVMDTAKIDCGGDAERQKELLSDVRYVSWIKKYGSGRVFFVSPSHNAQSFDQPALLQFYLDGIQYALGDLECDDSTIQ